MPQPKKSPAPAESSAVPDTLTLSERASVLLNHLKDLEVQLQSLDHRWAMNGSQPGQILGNGENGPVTYEVERNRLVDGQEKLIAANESLMPVVHALIKVANDQDAMKESS